MINKTDENFAVEAILSIFPESSFSISETYESLIWRSEDIDKPTKSEFDKALAKVKSDWEAKQYQRDRAVAFPSLQEQLDMQYWDKVNGTNKWQESVAKVKADNPKPE